MRILILRSRRRPGERRADRPYARRFGTAYAERVIGNLRGEEDFCSACGPECTGCRTAYGRRFGECIAGVIDLPAVLPYLLEDPARHVPGAVPPHELLLAIDVHEQVLLEFLRRAPRWGTRGVVVPLEAGDWLSGSGRQEARRICSERAIEIAFPKPFCDFDPPAGSVLAEFRDRFHVGRPAVSLRVRRGRIASAHVEVSAACGATYYVARWLAGQRVDDDLKFEVVAKRMHSYPCTASMQWDQEIGDTPMHVAAQAHYEILAPLARPAGPAGPAMVRSPVGTMVAKPVPARENIRKIRKARQVILDELAARGVATLAGLRRKPGVTPAAVYTALVLLQQEGKVRTDGERIRPA